MADAWRAPERAPKRTAPATVGLNNSSNSHSQSHKKARSDKAGSMKWTLPLTTIALETRYLDPRFAPRFQLDGLNTRKRTALWQHALAIVMARASREGAWGHAASRVITMEQYKNKLKAMSKLFRSKRNFLLDQMDGDDGANDSDVQAALADPARMAPHFRHLLNDELAALWPLLHDCLVQGGRPGFAAPVAADGADDSYDALVGATQEARAHDDTDYDDDEEEEGERPDEEEDGEEEGETRDRPPPPRPRPGARTPLGGQAGRVGWRQRVQAGSRAAPAAGFAGQVHGRRRPQPLGARERAVGARGPPQRDGQGRVRH